MRRWMFAVLAIVIMVTNRSTAAQELPWWTTCSPDTLSMMQDSTTAFDFTPACETFLACLETADADICQMRLAAALIETCEETDRVCQTQAMLVAAGVAPGYQDPFMPTPDMTEVADMVHTGLQRIDAEDYSAAATVYSSRDGSNLNPMLVFSRALALALSGDSEGALSALMDAVGYLPGHPLFRYARAMWYAELGDPVSASYDAYTFSRLLENDPELVAFAASAAAAYPLDLSEFETWMAYPLYTHYGSPAGATYIDHYREAPHPVQVMRSADGAVTLLDNLLSDRSQVPHADLIVSRFDAPNAEFVYSTREIQGRVLLDDKDYGYEVIHIELVFEGSTSTVEMLVPADAPDPRIGFTTVQCNLLTGLTPGQYVRPLYDADVFAFDLVNQPDGSVIGSEMTVRLLDQTACVSETLWWQVETDAGNTAWIRVNDGQQILVWALTSFMGPFYCPGVLPPRVTFLTGARVVEGYGANVLRSAPRLSAETAGALEEGAEFMIDDGPVCADGYVWFRAYSIEEGVLGWTAESGGGVYWLEPLPLQ